MVGLKPYHFFKKEVINIFKNKHIKITICLILIFTISINFMFYQKVQAEAITVGLAIKVMAVILSSMGVLHVVQNNGGIQSFFDSFTLFNHEGLNALRDMAFNNIVHKVRIKANSVIASIREFFNFWAEDNIIGDISDIPPGTKLYHYNNLTHRQTSTSPRTLEDVILYEDDFNQLRIHLRTYGYYGTHTQFQWELLLNGSRLGNRAEVWGSYSNPENTDYNVEYSVTVLENETILKYTIINYKSNQIFTGSRILYDKPILAIEYPPGYVDPTFDIPQPQSLPRNGVDIAWDEATNKSISYIPEETKLEKLIEDIANASVETFVEKYMSWGKATTDSLTGPIISTETRVNQETGVEEQVVTDVTETVFDDIYEETYTQTGLLGSILGAITDIKDFIKSIFIPEEFKTLDFSPLQNIGLSEKFPFSLPWDLKNSVVALTSNPEAPVFDVPIVSEVITLDFSEFESWASIIRVFTTLIFVIALIILTRRLI